MLMPMDNGRLHAVTFDFYNTLCHFSPLREERQEQAAATHGLVVSADALRVAYVAAEHFWTLENARRPIALLEGDDRSAFLAAYEQHLLAAAGVDVPPELALRVYHTYSQLPRGLVLFDDALPALRAAREGDAGVAVISNTDQNLEALCDELGLAAHLDALVCSCDVGCEKPAPAIFHAALARLSIAPQRALHIGDQYHSDVVGARGVGMRAVLLDRLGLLDTFADCARVPDLRTAVALASAAADPA
ncbi:MAG: HAD-IA family hydrolase [Chloroflexi bacterium]|nr:HAD-IA family hydrolase [Chloroflexota bacterium]